MLALARGNIIKMEGIRRDPPYSWVPVGHTHCPRGRPKSPFDNLRKNWDLLQALDVLQVLQALQILWQGW